MITTESFQELFSRNNSKMPASSKHAITSSLNQHAYRLVEQSLNAARIVKPDGKATVGLDNMMAAFQAHKLLSGGSSLQMKGGHAGTVMTGSFFDPKNAVDSQRYTSNESSVPVFPATPGLNGVIRHPLPATGFPLHYQAAGGADTNWLSMSSVNKLVQEYVARHAGCRVSSECRKQLRSNVAAGLNSIASKMHGKTVTMGQLNKYLLK
jgi:hypothetical protein